MDFKVNFKDLKSSNEYDKDKNPYKSFPHFVDPITGKNFREFRNLQNFKRKDSSPITWCLKLIQSSKSGYHKVW